MGVYCHDRQDKLELLSTGHRVYVLFRSLSRHQHTGFHLEYRAICGGEIKLKLGQEYEIMSPNFPEEYPTNSNCSWVVTSPPGYQVAFHFDQFEIERHDTCQYDFIEVRDGPRLGEKKSKWGIIVAWKFTLKVPIPQKLHDIVAMSHQHP